MATALNTLGIKSATEIKATEVKEIQEYVPANVYGAKIKEFGTYTSAKGSLMAFGEVELTVGDSTRVLKDYIFIPKEQTDADIAKDEKRAKNMKRLRDRALSKINGYIEAVSLSLETIETSIVKNNVSENFNRFNGVACDTPVTAFVLVEHTAGSQYEWKNVIEAIFDKDGMNSEGQDQKEVFLSNVAKKPIIEKKPVTVVAGSGSSVSQPTSSAASKL